MADSIVGYPGSSPTELDTRVVKPLEKLAANIPGVEHVYSTSTKEGAMVIVQVHVCEDIESSFVKLHNKMNKYMEHIPDGETITLIKNSDDNDVQIMSIKLMT